MKYNIINPKQFRINEGKQHYSESSEKMRNLHLSHLLKLFVNLTYWPKHVLFFSLHAVCQRSQHLERELYQSL